jgi:hypothetical protein
MRSLRAAGVSSGYLRSRTRRNNGPREAPVALVQSSIATFTKGGMATVLISPARADQVDEPSGHRAAGCGGVRARLVCSPQTISQQHRQNGAVSFDLRVSLWRSCLQRMVILTVPTPPFPRSRDRVVRSMVLAVCLTLRDLEELMAERNERYLVLSPSYLSGSRNASVP